MARRPQVTWVGKSSMEVTLELWAHPTAVAEDGPAGDVWASASRSEVRVGIAADEEGALPPLGGCCAGNALSHERREADGEGEDPVPFRAPTAIAHSGRVIAVAKFVMAARSPDLLRSASVRCIFSLNAQSFFPNVPSSPWTRLHCCVPNKALLYE